MSYLSLRALRALFCGLLLTAWAPLHAEVLGSVDSPSHALSVKVQLEDGGRLTYQVLRKGKLLIAPSRLGFLLANAPQMDQGFALAASAVSAHDDTWEQPWGERRFVRNHYQELRLDLVQKDQDGRKMAVVFRVFDDGVGFRYEFPEQPQLPLTQISDELTEFVVAPVATAWWQEAGEKAALEYPIRRTPLAEVGTANTPITIRTADGTHIAFHEAALVDYASMWLRKVAGQTLRAQLTPSAFGPPVERHGAFTTPWRTMQIADDAAGLYMSDLVLNLNEPNKLGDVSWVQPGKFVGVWWEMHLEQSTWGAGPKHGATTANTKRYIDFAARNGFRGVLVEGWNLGWDGNWSGSGSSFSFTQPYPDFDLPAVTDYARAKGVRLIGHHETGGNIARYEQQMDAGYQLYAKLGVDSIKSGYVTDAGTALFPGPNGSTHFGYTDSQEGARHYLKAVTEAARYKLAIDTHEPIKDTGLRRTYPNWISREGARGMEYNAWGNPINSVDHEVNLVFTRMLSGPMDYTPGILSLEGVKGRPINSTQAKQLASFVVIYSPVVMAADLIENYEKYPGPFQFIKDVPTDWSDTRVLHGQLGEYATIARKDRRSDDWYVGSITDGKARTLSLPLSFLDAGKRYTAEIYRDGPQADYRNKHRYDLVIEKKTVTAASVLTLKLAPGGGQAIRLTPLR
ncbi:glycoside hydrolase family 97 protein [Duganella sp. FT80W]|uniref:Glycoside hydrolase family 97 protein n=1 Tax=Duganella guangzhouensis TaxID=2666084 RepID=A0A6I2L127_9BURK|nr:glycoside hydrolase family 97 protein [Duganella guangzhouensis]MRW90434.1 glycoside hydrolase family 97 protein [Duganella guangzhouensis]